MSLDTDHPAARLALGFGATFAPVQPRLVEGMSGFYERYFDRYRSELRWCLFASPKRYQLILDKHRAAVRHALSKAPEKSAYFQLHDNDGEDGWASRRLDARCIGSEDQWGREWGTALFFQARTVPTLAVREHLLDLARSIVVRYAVGGFIVGHENPWGELAFRLCTRFVGVEYWTYHETSRMAGIRSTNWLTLVTNELLRKVGGIGKVRQKLSAAIEIHEVLDGYCFQAGPQPVLGDVNQPDELAAYREVAQALKPLRDKNARWGSDHQYQFSHDEVTTWLARFDKNPPKLKLPPDLAPPDPEALAAFAAKLAPIKEQIGEPLVDRVVAMEAGGAVDFDVIAKLEHDYEEHGELGIAAHGLSIGAYMGFQIGFNYRVALEPELFEKIQAARKRLASKRRKR